MAQAQQRDLAVVIGLEVHVQLETETKIFCGCSTAPAAEPNSQTCPVCLGLPGALPVVNEAAVEAAVKVGKAIDATIPEETRFHRKNYYYPDLPKNFQITQYDEPLCQDGHLECSVGDQRRRIGIRRAHLEEDPGSLKHSGGSIDTADYTLVDYNRAGVPLMEIVTEPDFRGAEEVRAFLSKLEEVLEYLGVFDASRDGSLRVDANLSVVESDAVDDGHVDEDTLADANRTEVKNISRHWDESRGITVSMRSKEEEKDYRYFREGDLPVLRVAEWKDSVEIPELPDARRERFQTEYGLSSEAADKLTSTRQVAEFYEAVAREFDPDLAATWVADELLGELNYRDMSITDITDRLDEVERLVELVADEEITAKNARETVLRSMLDDGRDPDAVVTEENLGKTSDDAVAEAVTDAVADNPDAVEDYHDGEDGALNFLVGQVMQATGGSADPGTVNKLLREELAD